MRIIDCLQRSEEWDRWRNRPTASEFGKLCTPVKGNYSSQATAYAAKIVAKKLGVYTEPPPTFWMEWGTEHEPNAKHAYTKQTGREIQDVGFVVPDGTDAYGCSPDGLVDPDGQLEIKCPAPENLIALHAEQAKAEEEEKLAAEKEGRPVQDVVIDLPPQYKPQVQGQLLITGRHWCDFYVWHPLLTPFLLRVEPDLQYQEKIADGLLQLLHEINRIERQVSRMRHELVSVGTMQSNVKLDGE